MGIETKSAANDSGYRTDAQRASDRASLSEHGSAASGMKRDFGEKATDVADNLAHHAHDAGHAIQDAGQSIAKKSKHAHGAVCSFTKENPTTAVLIAFGIGAILARILPGR
ncbi:MAG: hypothetical protein EA379_05265 [Phycisphaerales bacterium]|jgi:ElaB/YqjD/DUF883 family membrane-anchored ribosome-binding protein|nr:MAG: hypothetical protein EA379_05265 [Phycisphaerales bacterium]